jgi:hypothetical protein
MKTTQKISRNEFLTLMLNSKGAMPCSLTYKTNVKMKKEGISIFGEIMKINFMQAFLGASYENSVNRQLEREEKEKDFIAQPIWKGKGKRINLCLVQHTDTNKYYLSVLPLKTLKTIFFDNMLNLVEKSKIQPYFYAVNKPQNQGTDKEIYHLEIGIENVLKVKMNKITYILD